MKLLRILDRGLFYLSLVFLFFSIFSFGRANIQADSIDYYAILQRISGDKDRPIVGNLHFMEQRSPGYPILAAVPYYITKTIITPFVKTEIIRQESFIENKPSEQMQLPAQPLLFRDIFFKNFYIEREGRWFRWEIIFLLLLTSYILLFTGIIFIVKTMLLENKKISFLSLIPVTVITSGVFMHNIINTPAYATLAAFGVSSIFCYFFIKSISDKMASTQFFTGLFLGLLVLTRFETVVIFGVIFLFILFSFRDMKFLRNFLLGSSVSLILLIIYNVTQFGTILHSGILKGDINVLSLDFGYMFANVLSPQAGIIFWSPTVSLGIVGLILSHKKYLKILGLCSIVLIGLILVRVPVMYQCVGQGTLNIGGLPVSCPRNTEEALLLVRFDINRYVVVLIPFAIIGMQDFIVRILKKKF